jgi:hypothetical protein
MLNPLLGLFLAAAAQAPGDSPDYARVVALEIVVQAVQAAELAPVAVDDAPSVRDIPYYFDDFRPAAAPAAPLLITYDWRSPVVFDAP